MPRDRAHEFRAKREAARAAGVCTRCFRNPTVSGRSTCEQCIELVNQLNKLRRERWLRAGLCQSCGGQITTVDGTLCDSCRAVANKRNADAKQSGVCPICKVRKPDDGYVTCRQCLDDKRVNRIESL